MEERGVWQKTACVVLNNFVKIAEGSVLVAGPFWARGMVKRKRLAEGGEAGL